MTMRTRNTIALLVTLSITLGTLLAAGPAPTVDAKVVAYYFHGAQRCKTCLHIESTAQSVLRERFAAEMKAGRLEWRVVDFDKPENEHFVKDFQLVSSSVVLVAFEGEAQLRYKVLDRAWRLAHDDMAFETYVEGETAAFLKAPRG
jgi:hypothetical protein